MSAEKILETISGGTDLEQLAKDEAYKVVEQLKQESSKLAKETMDSAYNEANDLLNQFSSGNVKKEQLISLINHIVSAPMPI